MGHHVQVNNMASVYILNTWRYRDKFLLKCACEIWLLAATYNFNISAIHVSFPRDPYMFKSMTML